MTGTPLDLTSRRFERLTTAEGLASDFVRQVQQLRKDAQLAIADHVRIFYYTTDATLQQTVAEWSDYIEKNRVLSG